MLDRPAEPEGPVPQRQPIFNIPGSVVAVLATLVAVHVGRRFIGDGWDDALFSHLAFVPGRLTYGFAPDRVVAAMVDLARQGAEGYRSAPLARRFGAVRFFAFLIVTALAGALVHWAAHPLDLAPVIGASASVSGCMGATLRFMFQPEVRVAAPVEAAGEGRRRASLRPAQPLREVVRDRRAVTFLIAWFATNLLFGLGSISLGLGNGPIAWEAHIGGFLVGLLLFGLFDPARGPIPADVAPTAPEEPPV